jgi:SAM-dependent methyltransferase
VSDSANYDSAIAGEAGHWDSFIARRLMAGEIPGSIDFRLFFTQFCMRLGWQPPSLGPIEITFRRRQIRELIQRAVPEPGVRVLDLGCGAGWLSLELARRGGHVTAVDISPANLALARYAAETNGRNFPYLYQQFAGLPCDLPAFGSVTHVQGDLNTIDLPPHEYDVVVVWDSLHHVAALERLLDNVRGALKPGGVFIGLDHTEAGFRSGRFNEELKPIIHDAYRWVTEHDPGWLYDAVDLGARGRAWGDLTIDRPVAPIPGCDEFLERVRREMLQIVSPSVDLDDLPPLKALDFVDTEQGTISPFEDVSAARLTSVLLERFKARRFDTVCPVVLDRALIPEPRSPQERVFQHYMSALLIELGEQAIQRGQAVGQWFVFELTAEAPDPDQLRQYLQVAPDPTETHIKNLSDLIERLRSDLDARQVHVRNLETLLQRQERSNE